MRDYVETLERILWAAIFMTVLIAAMVTSEAFAEDALPPVELPPDSSIMIFTAAAPVETCVILKRTSVADPQGTRVILDMQCSDEFVCPEPTPCKPVSVVIEPQQGGSASVDLFLEESDNS